MRTERNAIFMPAFAPCMAALGGEKKLKLRKSRLTFLFSGTESNHPFGLKTKK
jgi:hypothetical protein